ncbi:hypothetical protein EW026_g3164 [Hermanssonia centrifuga]|uniref:E2 ubiquitin-conjugating enzyme n=1 Tax=Hermanssonia centrifuga TaxID=98765 RepID=A0A4S4KL10_9APHY|nr:hypothetical protein EW026_g3164 [Hermanssonia centrifuga]
MPPSLASSTTLKRIHREIADLKKEDLGNITLVPSSDSLFVWKARLPGPEGSVYEGGFFDVDISLAHDYPFSAPRMTFRTRIYHMNISDRGGICIDILKHNWSPALSLFKVILSLSSLLTDPNPKDPLVPSIANEYVRNRAQHDRTARQWTQLYAQPPPPPAPSIVTPLTVPNSRAKGKARHTSLNPSIYSSRANSAAPSTPGPSNASTPVTIEIEDSDEERNKRPVASRRPTAVKRKRGSGAVDVDLVAEEEAEARARRRRAGDGPSGLREVIVIED